MASASPVAPAPVVGSGGCRIRARCRRRGRRRGGVGSRRPGGGPAQVADPGAPLDEGHGPARPDDTRRRADVVPGVRVGLAPGGRVGALFGHQGVRGRPGRRRAAPGARLRPPGVVHGRAQRGRGRGRGSAAPRAAAGSCRRRGAPPRAAARPGRRCGPARRPCRSARAGRRTGRRRAGPSPRSKKVGAAPTVVASSPASNPAKRMSAPGPLAQPSQSASRSRAAARRRRRAPRSPRSSSSIGRKCRARKSWRTSCRRSSSTSSSKVQSSRAVMVSWSVAMRSSMPAGVDVRTGHRRPRASPGGLVVPVGHPAPGRFDHVRQLGRRQWDAVVVRAGPRLWAGAGRPRPLVRCTPGCHQPMWPKASAHPMFSFHVRSSTDATMSSAVRARIHCSTPCDRLDLAVAHVPLVGHRGFAVGSSISPIAGLTNGTVGGPRHTVPVARTAAAGRPARPGGPPASAPSRSRQSRSDQVPSCSHLGGPVAVAVGAQRLDEGVDRLAVAGGQRPRDRAGVADPDDREGRGTPTPRAS